jgi:hypothetical protein
MNIYINVPVSAPRNPSLIHLFFLIIQNNQWWIRDLQEQKPDLIDLTSDVFNLFESFIFKIPEIKHHNKLFSMILPHLRLLFEYVFSEKSHNQVRLYCCSISSLCSVSFYLRTNQYLDTIAETF